MKALLVDDEIDFLDQTKIFLEKELKDLILDTSPHVEDALQKLKEEDYDAVISDYQMPEIDGLEFLKILREDMGSEIPFIIFTGRGREKVAMKALNLGANRYLQKGGDPRSQYGVLANALVKEIKSHKKEERLRESERTYREIFEKAGIPIFIHDKDTGKVINANEEAAELYGYSKNEITEKGVGSFSAGGKYDQDSVKEQIQKTLENGPQTFIWRGEKKDGTKTWEEVKLKPAEIKGETRVLAAIRDITELKNIEREKEKNLKELQFINDTIIQVSRMDNIDKICNFIGEQIHSVNENSYVFVSLYDKDEGAITLRSITGLGQYEDVVLESLEDSEGIGMRAEDMGEEKKLYTSGKIENVPLHVLLSGKMDKETCESFEDLLDIEDTYTVGFALEEKPYGGIIILKKDKEGIEYRQAIETLASHLSVMLQHKQEEEKRKTVEKRYNALYKRSLDGVYILDLKGNFIDANPRALYMLGYSKDELDSLTYQDIMTETSVKKVNRAMESVLETGAQEKPMEIRLVKKDGSKIWIETKTHLMYKDGEPYAFQGIARDITKRKEIEKEMKKKERAIQTSLNGIVMAKLNGEVHYVNDSLIDMWGYEKREEILGENTKEFFYDEEKIKQAIRHLKEKGEWKGEMKGVKKDGTVFDVFISANLIYDENGFAEDILGSVVDISQNKITEKKIEKLHDVTRKLERCEDEEEVYEIAIEAAEKILDFEMCTIDVVEGKEFVVKATSSSVPSDGTRSGSYDEGIAGKTYQEGDSFLITDISDNSTADPVKNEYRSALSVPIGDFGVFQAVSTERNHFDEKDVNMAELLMDHVRDTMKRIRSTKKQEFLHSLLRHDVKNKTQIVEGYLHLLKDEDLSYDQTKFVEKALKAANEGQDILEKVKTLKEIEEEDIKQVDIISPLHDAIESSKKVSDDIEIVINSDEKPYLVKGGALLEELFFNVINNAINHSSCDNINISFGEKSENCLITIEDDGKGIPDDEKNKIFKKGYKKGDEAGSGLGLHLVKTIVENYGGSIEVKDSSMGGARFDIYLKKVQ